MSLHAVDALTFVGSQEDRCEIRCNMLYGEGEPEFEIILSTYVYAYPIEATFLLLVHVLTLYACMLVFSIETNVLLLDIGLRYMHSPSNCLIGHADDDLS